VAARIGRTNSMVFFKRAGRHVITFPPEIKVKAGSGAGKK
jgi:hypothetical protein